MCTGYQRALSFFRLSSFDVTDRFYQDLKDDKVTKMLLLSTHLGDAVTISSSLKFLTER